MSTQNPFKFKFLKSKLIKNLTVDVKDLDLENYKTLFNKLKT